MTFSDFTKSVWPKMFPVIRNKYFISSVVALVWMLFFDQHNIIRKVKELNEGWQVGGEKKEAKIQ